jgi:hypothetical protein
MAKLEDIPKKQIFNVPDGYFDKLPSRIQSRVSDQRSARMQPVLRYAMQYALPVLLVAAILFYFYRPSNPEAASILASVETEDLIIFLQETDLTTDDVLENIEFSTTDLEAIEDEVYALDPGDEIDLELNSL